MKSLFVLTLLFIGFAAQSQSMFKPLPIQSPKVNHFSHAVILPTDSLPNISNGKFQGFRFAGPDILFAIPDLSLWTGLGIDFVWATANMSTGKWDYDYTVGIRITGGANLGTPTIKTLGGFGVRATFFKGLLAVGGIWNLTLKHAQGAIGNPAALIPGLN